MVEHHPKLIAISDVETYGRATWLAAIKRLCDRARPGSVAVQLRDRQLSGALALTLATELRALTRSTGQLLSVGDRLDIAVLVEADGVHLPGGGVSADDARGLLPSAWLTAPWHVDEDPPPGVDALLLSPVMAPRKGREALGVDRLRQISGAERRGVYALGGVTAQSAAACCEAGATGVAAIGAVARDPLGLVRALGIERR